MYSVVMMAAMIAGGETTDFGGRSGWYPGCYGCYGYGYCGGKGGCWGGCYGGCCGGYYGSCYGCCGGCYGGCYGGCCGGYNGWGSCYSCGGGCYSWGACCGGGYYGPAVIPHAAPTMPPATSGDKPKTDDKPKTEASIPANRARLTVELPADAKLFIDDQPTQTTSGVRHFRTPELDPKQTYYYMVRVEIARGGKTHTEEKRVLLTPGAQINASFTEESLAGTAKKDGPSAKR